MNVISITDFKQNIGSYFDDIISSKKPLYIQRRKHSAMVLPLDDFSKDDIKMIEDLRISKNIGYVKIDSQDWVKTFNKISGKNQDSIILG